MNLMEEAVEIQLHPNIFNKGTEFHVSHSLCLAAKRQHAGTVHYWLFCSSVVNNGPAEGILWGMIQFVV
jgi:hypothetical protein